MLEKIFYKGLKELLPSKIVEGQVLYAEDENGLYLDNELTRDRLNPPADWNETNENSPSYIANKPGWHLLEPHPVYGVEWDYNNPSTKLTRIGDASNFSNPTPATSNSGIGSSPFDNIYPWSEMKMYNVENNQITSSQDDDGFSFNKDTVVKIPEFYYKVMKDTDTKKHSWSICGYPKKGFKKHPGSGKYVSRYHITGSSSEVFTKTGATPFVNLKVEEFRKYCKTTKGINWRMLDVATWSAIQMLYLIEFADWNSQNVLGKGYVKTSMGNVGGTDNASYHTVKISNQHNQYRYIEDIFSNVNDFVDGVRVKDNIFYISSDATKYNDSGSEYINTEVTAPTQNWIVEFAYNNNCDWLFIPSRTASNNGTEYITDYFSKNSNSGNGLYSVGGFLGDSVQFGIFTSYISDIQATSSSTGTRIIFEESV